jgi:hypothetical protein
MTTLLLKTTGLETLTTFTQALDFLDTQARFDEVFLNPVPVGNRSKILIDSIEKLISHCQSFEVLLQLFHLDYVGSTAISSIKAISSITAAIRALKQSIRNHKTGKITYLKPDDLFHKYMALSLLLPENVASWGLTLAHQFYATISEDCRNNIEREKSCTIPNAATLIAKSNQLHSL